MFLGSPTFLDAYDIPVVFMEWIFSVYKRDCDNVQLMKMVAMFTDRGYRPYDMDRKPMRSEDATKWPITDLFWAKGDALKRAYEN